MGIKSRKPRKQKQRNAKEHKEEAKPGIPVSAQASEGNRFANLNLQVEEDILGNSSHQKESPERVDANPKGDRPAKRKKKAKRDSKKSLKIVADTLFKSKVDPVAKSLRAINKVPNPLQISDSHSGEIDGGSISNSLQNNTDLQLVHNVNSTPPIQDSIMVPPKPLDPKMEICGSDCGKESLSKGINVVLIEGMDSMVPETPLESAEGICKLV